MESISAHEHDPPKHDPLKSCILFDEQDRGGFQPNTAANSYISACGGTSESKPQETVKAETVKTETVVIKKGGSGLAFLALLIALGLGGAGYYFGQQQVSQIQQKLTALEQQAETTNTAFHPGEWKGARRQNGHL